MKRSAYLLVLLAVVLAASTVPSAAATGLTGTASAHDKLEGGAALGRRALLGSFDTILKDGGDEQRSGAAYSVAGGRSQGARRLLSDADTQPGRRLLGDAAESQDMWENYLHWL